MNNGKQENVIRETRVDMHGRHTYSQHDVDEILKSIRHELLDLTRETELFHRGAFMITFDGCFLATFKHELGKNAVLFFARLFWRAFGAHFGRMPMIMHHAESLIIRTPNVRYTFARPDLDKPMQSETIELKSSEEPIEPDPIKEPEHKMFGMDLIKEHEQKAERRQVKEQMRRDKAKDQNPDLSSRFAQTEDLAIVGLHEGQITKEDLIKFRDLIDAMINACE